MPRTQTPAPNQITLRLANHSFPIALTTFVAASDIGTGSAFWREFRKMTTGSPVRSWTGLIAGAAAALQRAKEMIDTDRDYVTGLAIEIDDDGNRTAEWGTGRTRVCLVCESSTDRWFVKIRLEDETGQVTWWQNPVESLAARVAAGLGLKSPDEIETPVQRDILLAAAAYERRMATKWAQEDRHGSYEPKCLPRWEDNFPKEEAVAANDAGVEWLAPEPDPTEMVEEEA